MANDNLYRVDVAGIVLNEEGKFLLIRYASDPGKWIYPIHTIEKFTDTKWEVLEKSLSRYIYQETAIEIADGLIPVTDKIETDAEGTMVLTEYFICRYKYGKSQISRPEEVNEITWKSFTEISTEDVSAQTYFVLEKAHKFIAQIT